MAKKNQKQISAPVVITGIICVTGLEAYALTLGINGILLTSVIALIAAAIGVTIPLDRFIKK